MTTQVVHLEPQTLLANKAGDVVLSFRHRVLSAADGDQSRIEPSAQRIMEAVQGGELCVVDDEPTLRTCKGCGCTEAFACDYGCQWVAEDACSRCAGVRDGVPRCREAIEGDIASAFELAEHKQVNEALARIGLINAELLLDIREMLAYQAASQTAGLHALAGRLREDQSPLIAARGLRVDSL